MLLDIQPNDLHLKMQDPSFLEDAQLIDVREPEEVYEYTELFRLYVTDRALFTVLIVLDLRSYSLP